MVQCAAFLISEGLTSADLLGIWTHSAGAVTVGNVINNYNELFKVCILDVPFVDLLSLMLDETLPLTVAEYEEWGNPKKDLQTFARI